MNNISSRQILQAIFTAGYKAVLHIHAVVEECEIIELLQQIDPKTKKPLKKKVLFVKNGAVVICRIQVSFHRPKWFLTVERTLRFRGCQ